MACDNGMVPDTVYDLTSDSKCVTCETKITGCVKCNYQPVDFPNPPSILCDTCGQGMQLKPSKTECGTCQSVI
jgi:hypothetical protein